MSFVSYNVTGRLGNGLFMAANCLAYSMRHGLEYSIPITSTSDYWNYVCLRHLHNSNFNPNTPKIEVFEPHFHYAEIPFDESWRGKNIMLRGYFQSEKYFSDYKGKVIELFNYPWELKPDICSIHARFGDYRVIPGKHIMVDELYLRSAIQMIRSEKNIQRFKVFSDEPNYFKQNFGHIYDFEYSTNKTIEDDLIEGSCCHSHINSSSTFGWWMAYLGRNEDKMIITKREWFQRGWKDELHREVDTSTIIPENWIKL